MKHLFTLTLLAASLTASAQTTAMLVPADYQQSLDEKDAVAWFQTNYVDTQKGILLTPDKVSQLDAKTQTVCWVMCDREGIASGYANLPGSLATPETVKALKDFAAAGGNLLLTNHATQLTVALGRIDSRFAPGIYGNGTGGDNADTWGVQPVIGNVDGQTYDHQSHAIYSGLTTGFEPYGHLFYPFEGAGFKNDHNCMWDLNAYNLAANPNTVKAWEETTNSVVLGTWQHVVDYCCAGIVDFEPTTTFGGRIVAVGVAAYEWNTKTSTNTFRSNIERFTQNCLSYLAAPSAPSEPVVLQKIAAQFTMDYTGDNIAETVSGNAYRVASALPAFSVASPLGEALRFDGYSNYVSAAIPGAMSTETLTVSMTLAAETYPQMGAEYETPATFARLCGNLDEGARTGFAFELSSQGDLRFRYATANANGTVNTLNAPAKLTCGRWHTLTATMDKENNSATLYVDGVQVATGRMGRAELRTGNAQFFIGKDATEQKRQDKFLTNTFCGLIDDISIRNEVVAAAQIATPSEERPDFAYPAARYAQSLWRPQFHGMPTGGWTNECHGLTFSDGRWHVFFQKNANGPYMSRLHWGHISSANLYKWTEEPIALAPSEPYDMKGCWSGCIFDDNGKQRIIYTAVDNARAVMATATPADNSLTSWTKEGVIVNGKPQGLSDDFRDPYHFTVGGQEYLIVGSSKDGIGCCTLHKKTGSNWTNDGDIFFKGTNQAEHGTFWEMPNITPMDGGRWLFTCTPLNTNVGVRTLCFVGTIDGNGHFQAESMTPQTLEMNGISRDGYGLLSPSIYTKDGKTVLLGIVPDKISDTDNYRMGWAHNYSLPREISLDAQGHIVQKPYAALTNMRTQTAFASNAQLSGEQSLAPVAGRQIELLGDFTVGSGTFGFRFLKDGARSASLSYDTASGELTLDITGIDRTVQDNPYNGIYRVALPTRPAIGEKLRLHVFLDGSIADVFVADRWAFSVRLFPTNAAQTAAEAFATSATEADIQAWTLDAEQTTGTAINSLAAAPATSSFRLYDLQGRELAAAPAQGVYIRGGKKLVK